MGMKSTGTFTSAADRIVKWITVKYLIPSHADFILNQSLCVLVKKSYQTPEFELDLFMSASLLFGAELGEWIEHLSCTK